MPILTAGAVSDEVGHGKAVEVALDLSEKFSRVVLGGGELAVYRGGIGVVEEGEGADPEGFCRGVELSFAGRDQAEVIGEVSPFAPFAASQGEEMYCGAAGEEVADEPRAEDLIIWMSDEDEDHLSNIVEVGSAGSADQHAAERAYCLPQSTFETVGREGH